MLYELIAVCRPGRLNEVKEIAKTTGSLVLQNRGVIRGITNWGTFLLPKPKGQAGAATSQTVKHYTGHYFIMRFDAGARTQHIVRKTLGLDPRLLRYSVVKMGTTLDDIKDVPGVVETGADGALGRY